MTEMIRLRFYCPVRGCKWRSMSGCGECQAQIRRISHITRPLQVAGEEAV
jgi:hypothetical protein